MEDFIIKIVLNFIIMQEVRFGSLNTGFTCYKKEI